MDVLSTWILEKGLDGAFYVVRNGFKHVIQNLNELVGREVPARFSSVSEFWYEGVDNHGLNEGSLVEIDGVVSLYVPATPRHPRSVPGKQVDYWINMDKPVNNFAEADFFLWNDGIISLPSTKSNKAIVGINDKYGFVGQGGIPIIIDLENRHQFIVYNELRKRKPIGLESKIKGRLINFYSDNIIALGFPKIDAERIRTISRTLPSFAIEAYDIRLGKPHTILTGSIWIGSGSHKVSPVYCDLFKYEDHARAIAALDASSVRERRQLRAYYDANPIVPWTVPTPILNQELQDDFRTF